MIVLATSILIGMSRSWVVIHAGYLVRVVEWVVGISVVDVVCGRWRKQREMTSRTASSLRG